MNSSVVSPVVVIWRVCAPLRAYCVCFPGVSIDGVCAIERVATRTLCITYFRDKQRW